MMQRFKRPLLVSILVALVLYFASLLVADHRAILAAVQRLDWTGWAAILGLSLVNYLLRFYRWEWYLMTLGYVLPRRLHLAYYLAGFALTTTPGKAGEAVRSLYLRTDGVGYRHSLAVLFVERFLDLVAVALLALLAAFAVERGGWLPVAVGLLMLASLPIIHSPRLPAFLLDRVSAIPSRLGTVLAHLADLLKASATLLRAGNLYFGLGFGVLAWGAEGFALFLILDTLDVTISVPLAVGVYAIAVLVGALSFIPGGLGSMEAAMGLLLVAGGAEPSIAVAATLICRVATLWFAVLIGLLAMGTLEWRGYSLAGFTIPSLDRKEPR